MQIRFHQISIEYSEFLAILKLENGQLYIYILLINYPIRDNIAVFSNFDVTTDIYTLRIRYAMF